MYRVVRPRNEHFKVTAKHFTERIKLVLFVIDEKNLQHGTYPIYQLRLIAQPNPKQDGGSLTQLACNVYTTTMRRGNSSHNLQSDTESLPWVACLHGPWSKNFL